MNKISRVLKADTDILLDDDILPDDDEDDEEFLVNRARHPYHLKELDCSRWKEDLKKDKETLSKALKSVKEITPERDGKLKAIKEHIRDKAQNPTDRQGRQDQPQAAGVHYLQGHSGVPL